MKQPVTTYLERIRIELHVIRELVPVFYREVELWFWCHNKVQFSRRGARKVKRENNRDFPGSTCKIRCERCKRWHVFTTIQRQSVIDEVKRLIQIEVER